MVEYAAAERDAYGKVFSVLKRGYFYLTAQATTALQISIALAAIALLTRRKWLEWGMFGVAGLGVLLGAAALMHL